MCGINCIFDFQHKLSDKSHRVQWMNDQMTYRGPDGKGIFTDEQVAMAMRRLSIIDIAGGDQPLYNEDRSLVLILNGEIYNYVELMQDLKSRGHQFMSASDAETVLHLYEEKGERCLDDLRGMFALVLWDTRRHRLFAARDHIGIKPLYVAEHNGVLWLSSELKTIVGAAHLMPTIRPAALYQFLLHSFAIDPRHTTIEQVQRVLPGEYLIADTSGIHFKRYWTPRFGGDDGLHNRSDDELLETLQTAVQLHLRSDVPVGILLSGGIDSSAVAAFAARSSHNYTVLCAGYAGNHQVDERPQAHATAEALGLPHVDVILDSATYQTDFDELVRYCDEPVGDPAAMPQWSLYRQARQRGHKVLLSGIGGDEVFFGYPGDNLIGEQSRALSADAFKRWTGLNQSAVHQHTQRQLDYLMTDALRAMIDSADEPLYSFRDQAPQGPDATTSVLFGSYLVHNGCYLADRLGMGCSVEVRVPLIDHILVQSIFDLPLARRFDVQQSKILLRRLLRGLVPDAVLSAPKRAFEPPGNFLNDLASRNTSEILDSAIVRLGWICRDKLEMLCAQHNALPFLRRHRIRQWLDIPQAGWLLFKVLAFERWYAGLSHLPQTD